METEQRSAIGVVFTLGVVLALFLAGTMTATALSAGPASQATQSGQQATPTTQQVNATANETATITVSTTGDAEAEPDLAILRLESSATATDPETATNRLARNVSRLRTALGRVNVSDDQIRTTDYNLFEVSDRGEPGRHRNVTRYRAQQGITVEIQNTSRAGVLVDVAVANGVTAIRGVEFTLSEETQSELRNQALEEAMGDARSQAETLAATENLQLTGVRSISTMDGVVQPFELRESAALADAPTQIDGGPVIVVASVQVTYNAIG